MKAQNYKYSNLFSTNAIDSNEEIYLPSFQRDFVWTDDQQAFLISSFLLQIPIGSFLLVKGKRDSFYSRKIGEKEEVEKEGEETAYFLLDGQQRMSTLKVAFSDYFSIEKWKENYEILYSGLQKLWFIDIFQEMDFFGVGKLRFEKDAFLNADPTDIRDLISSEKIFKKSNVDKWFHPGQDFNTTYSSKKQVLWAQKISNEGKIPLFDVLSENKILRNCLENHARKQIQVFQSEIESDYKKLNDYLGHLEKDVCSLYEEKDFESINSLWSKLENEWINNTVSYLKNLFETDAQPIIVPEEHLGRATTVFEYMNKQGTSLSTFDILVARYAKPKDEETLTEKLDHIINDEIEIPNSIFATKDKYKACYFGLYAKNNTINNEVKNLFLQTLSLLNRKNQLNEGEVIAKSDISFVKKDKLLSLTREDIDNVINRCANAIQRSFAFIQYRLGVPSFVKFPYKLMVLPTAYFLEDDKIWLDQKKINLLEIWYWVTIFGGYFREQQNKQFIIETQILYDDLFNGHDNVIRRIEEMFTSSKYSDDDTLLFRNTEERGIPKAVSSTMLHFMLSINHMDLLDSNIDISPWKLYDSNIELEDHHIIPISSVTRVNESTKELRNSNHILNSIANRVLVTKESNRLIGNKKPTTYLEEIKIIDKNAFCLPDLKEYNFKDESDNIKFVEKRLEQIKDRIFYRINDLKKVI